MLPQAPCQQVSPALVPYAAYIGGRAWRSPDRASLHSWQRRKRPEPRHIAAGQTHAAAHSAGSQAGAHYIQSNSPACAHHGRGDVRGAGRDQGDPGHGYRFKIGHDDRALRARCSEAEGGGSDRGARRGGRAAQGRARGPARSDGKLCSG